MCTGNIRLLFILKDVQRHPGDAKCVTEILDGGKNKKLGRGTKFKMC